MCYGGSQVEVVVVEAIKIEAIKIEAILRSQIQFILHQNTVVLGKVSLYTINLPYRCIATVEYYIAMQKQLGGGKGGSF